MPSISAKDLKLIDDLRKEYRIVFAGEVQPQDWPECHRSLQGHVTELGDKKFNSYAIDSDLTDDTPWKSEVKQLARSLTERAKRNRHRNESSWRFSCEPFIFARLSGEVVCRNCRKRVWRSEIEAGCGDGNRRGLALQKRQRTREACRCHRMARSQDQLEAVGLNPIFGHREDEAVRHDPSIAERLGKKIQKPDAIFGLRQTRNIQNLLHDTRKRQSGPGDAQLLVQELQPSPINQPLDQNGDELLYPFLVLEAKSGTSDCDWHSIQMQTAFSIRTFLETQHRLLTAPDSHKPHQSPLVWFFANRGEDWRVSVAFMAKGIAQPNTVGDMDYIVADVWRGSVLTLDGALQLLLLVDYVFDWARDVYRDEIISTLRILASGDNDAASVLYADSNIFSTRFIDQPELHSSAEEDENYKAYVSAQAPFVDRDPKLGVVRHATFVESRYCCVLATRDNIGTMLQSTTESTAQKLCRMILDHIFKAILLERSAIEAMEQRWTGTVRSTPTVLESKTAYYTIISCTNYLSGSWHQVRELYAIAIAEDAWISVVEGSGLKRKSRRAKQPPDAQHVDTDTLLKAIGRLQAGTPEDSLLACITRRAIELRVLEDHRSKWRFDSPVDAPELDTSTSETPFLPTKSDTVLRDIVHYMYSSFKKGRVEPQEPFLKFSKRFDQQHLLRVAEKPIRAGRYQLEKLHPSEEGYVLIQGGKEVHDPERSPSDTCIYLVKGDPVLPAQWEVAYSVRRCLMTRDMHHTIHDNRTSNIYTERSLWGSLHHWWNLSNIYGMISDLGVVKSLIRKFCDVDSPPDRLGSPRVSDGVLSGAYLFRRELFSWRDRLWIQRKLRTPAQTSDAPLFFIYKLMSQEVYYWREVSIARRTEGTWACKWCADTEAETGRAGDICNGCLKESRKLTDPAHFSRTPSYRWLVNCFMGKPPFAPQRALATSEYALFVDWISFALVWNESLSTYPLLQQPFSDIGQLLEQAAEFEQWSKQRREGLRQSHRRERSRKRPMGGSRSPSPDVSSKRSRSD